MAHAIKVFVSYTHDSSEYINKVKLLADKLCGDGADCIIDQYFEAPVEGWPRWMVKNIDDARYVLVACTKTYLQRANGEDESSGGLGGKWESFLTYQELYENSCKNDKYIPIIFLSADKEYIPKPLRAFTYYDLSKNNGYEKLFRRLSNQSKAKQPKVNELRELEEGVVFDNMNFSDKADTKTIVDSDTLEFEIVVDKPFKKFTKEHERAIGKAICELLDVADIKIKGKRKGSTVLKFQITPQQAEKLYWEIQGGALSDLGINDAWVVDSSLSLGETDKIKAVYEHIAEKIGTTQYQVWFKGATQLSINEDCFEVTVPNPFTGNWIERHFCPAISESICDVFGRPYTIRFQIDPLLVKTAGKTSFSPPKHERNLNSLRCTPASSITSSGDHPLKLTLSSYVVGTKNQLAYDAAQTIISQPESPFNPLFLHGDYGVGKTHLLQGICNEIHQARGGGCWAYLSAEDFAKQYVVALKSRELNVFRNRFRNLDLLAIDDIHFLANKKAMQEEFLHTFNSIDLAGKQVVLASDAHPKEISQLCEKLVNRFVSGMVVRIDAPDFEMRCRICAQRIKSMKLSLSQEVIEYVASSISANVRELEGALIKLAAFASLSGQKISLAFAQQVLAEHIAPADPVVHCSDIVSAAAAFFEVSVTDIHSARKDRSIMLARSFAMYLMRRFTKMSFPEIGRSMGGKNHATVILACQRIKNALKGNDQMKWHTRQGFREACAKDILDTLIEKISLK